MPNKLYSSIVKKNNTTKKTRRTIKHRKIQRGGDRNIASSLEDFIQIIEFFKPFTTTTRNSTTHKNNEFDFSNVNQNTYYTKLVSMIPCAIRLRDYKYKNRPTEYVFNNDLELVSKQTRVAIDNERGFGSDDKIVCISMLDGGYKIIMNDNTKYFADLCSTQVQLVELEPESISVSGHAIILVLNHNKPKSFSVIDPNGGGTIVGDNLNDIKFSTMLAKIITGYNNIHIDFPPCQRMSVFMPGSCLLWSLLFTELVVRYGLDQAKSFFTSKAPLYLNDLIKKYATYIMKVLQAKSSDEDVFIYSNYYLKAGEIRSKIWEILRNIKFNDITKLGQVKVLRYKNIKIIFIPGLSDTNWILEVSNLPNTSIYKILSNDVDTQELCTLIKAFNDNFDTILKWSLEECIRQIMVDDSTQSKKGYLS